MVKIKLIDLITKVGYEIPEDLTEIKIGRSTQNNYITLPNRKYLKSLSDNSREKNELLDLAQRISGKHCTIYQKSFNFTIIDNKSKNGTYVDDELVLPETEVSLKNGSVIRLAKHGGEYYELEVRIEGEEVEEYKLKEEGEKGVEFKGSGIDDFDFDIDEGDEYRIEDDEING